MIYVLGRLLDEMEEMHCESEAVSCSLSRPEVGTSTYFL